MSRHDDEPARDVPTYEPADYPPEWTSEERCSATETPRRDILVYDTPDQDARRPRSPPTATPPGQRPISTITGRPIPADVAPPPDPDDDLPPF